MARRMSVSMTLDAVRNRTKTVTRRHVDTWKNLKPGDRLTLIEKGMGLPKGAKQVVVAEVEVVDVSIEPIFGIERHGEIRAEGFDPYEWPPLEWATMWAGHHGYSIPIHPGTWLPIDPEALDEIPCRRIEWRYLDAPGSGSEPAVEVSHPTPTPIGGCIATALDDGSTSTEEA